MDQRNDTRSKFQVAIDHLFDAEESMNKASNTFSSIVLDIQKGADNIRSYRDTLIQAVEDSGGKVSIERQMQDFVPRSYRRPEHADANTTRDTTGDAD